MPDEYEPKKFSQTRGLAFQTFARLLAQTDFNTRQGVQGKMVLELWETRGGAYITTSSFHPAGGGISDGRANVFQIGEPDPARPWITFAPTEEARQWDVLEGFDWNQRAMKMLNKMGLGWSFVREVA